MAASLGNTGEPILTSASFTPSDGEPAIGVPIADVEVPNPSHPYGVRGQGEIPLVPTPATIANAVPNAIGVRMIELPITPDRILQRLGVIE